MHHTGFCVLEFAGGWQIGWTSEGGPEIRALDEAFNSVDGWADQVAQLLHSLGYAGEGIVLGLASSRCLSRALPIEHSSLSRDRQALAYSLETWLPIAAEDLITDFLVDRHDALGVAIQTDDVAPLVKALEDRAIVVQSICPVAMLALQHHLSLIGNWGRHLVAWRNEDLLDLWLIDGAWPRQWRLLPAEPAAVVREIRFLTLADGTLPAISPTASETPTAGSPPWKLAAYEATDDLIQAISELPTLELAEVKPETAASAAIANVNEILAGHREPWIDFRRGALAPQDRYRAIRGAIRFSISAAVVAAIMFVAAFLVRAERYERDARRLQDAQVQLFQQCFPGQAVPVGIRSRLESEHAKLTGLAGVSTSLPATSDSLNVLFDLLASLPNDVPVRLVELRMDKGRVHMEWEVSSHGHADRIADSLRERGFQVEQPHTQLLADGNISLRMDAVH